MSLSLSPGCAGVFLTIWLSQDSVMGQKPSGMSSYPFIVTTQQNFKKTWISHSLSWSSKRKCFICWICWPISFCFTAPQLQGNLTFNQKTDITVCMSIEKHSFHAKKYYLMLIYYWINIQRAAHVYVIQKKRT